MNMLIRDVREADAARILAIYAPYVIDTDISFETEPPAPEAFAERIRGIQSAYPYLVCLVDGELAGYAYASKHHERAAYRYSVDVSIYVAPNFHRRGVGRALYLELFDRLKERGFYTAFAGITQPNEKSVGLHASLGFTEVGVFHRAGYKHGRWLDVLWMEKPLRDSYDKLE